MKELTVEEKERILDILGKQVIEIRDGVLESAIRCAIGKSLNSATEEKYRILRTLTSDQRERINELLSNSIDNIIFEFLNNLGNETDLIITDDDGNKYNYCNLTEHGGIEIVVIEDLDIEKRDDWITKFSKIKI